MTVLALSACLLPSIFSTRANDHLHFGGPVLEHLGWSNRHVPMCAKIFRSGQSAKFWDRVEQLSFNVSPMPTFARSLGARARSGYASPTLIKARELRAYATRCMGEQRTVTNGFANARRLCRATVNPCCESNCCATWAWAWLKLTRPSFRIGRLVVETKTEPSVTDVVWTLK